MGVQAAEAGVRRVRGVPGPGRVRRGEASGARGRRVRRGTDPAAGQLRGGREGLRETDRVPAVP